MTGQDKLAAMHQLNLAGNIIPHSWYKTITFDNGKPNLLAIVILAEIVYWWRPRVVKDERSGQVLGLEKRFKADLLQRSYDSFADQFGVTKRQARDAVVMLETVGIVARVFRTIDSPAGPLSNVLFLDLDPVRLAAATFPEGGYDILMSHPPHPDVTPPSIERQTYTETTTETTLSGEDDFSDLFPEPAPVPPVVSKKPGKEKLGQIDPLEHMLLTQLAPALRALKLEWPIENQDELETVSLFLQTTGYPVPTEKAERQRWLVGVRQHHEEYGPAQTRRLYQMVWPELKEQVLSGRLTLTHPAALSHWMKAAKLRAVVQAGAVVQPERTLLEKVSLLENAAMIVGRREMGQSKVSYYQGERKLLAADIERLYEEWRK